MPPSPTQQIIIDTDLNFDDAMAILYLLQHPYVEVLAITVTGTGLTRLPMGAENALRLLELTGQSSKVLVAAGASVGRSGDRTQRIPVEWRNAADSLMNLALPLPAGKVSHETAPELLSRLIHESPHPVSILAIGPLTNLANALEADPAISEMIGRITIMGGALQVPGNLEPEPGTQPVAEWNFHLDPWAAQQVIASGVPITLIPLDATSQVPVTQAFVDQLKKHTRSEISRTVVQGLEVLADEGAIGDWYQFWDPLAAVIASDARVARIESHRIKVLSDDGQTVLDESGYRVDVATEVRAEAFEGKLIEVWNRGVE